MKSYQFLFRCFAFVLFITTFQACVEDDDFDVPVIPDIEEVGEVISQGGSSASFDACFIENFESYDEDLTELPFYENVSTLNTRLWEVSEFAGNQYLSMSAFQATGDVIAYLVVPVDFDTADFFSFKTQDRFSNGDPLEVYIVTNYEISGNIADADVEEITDQFDIATGNTEAFTNPFVCSGNFDLSNYSGNGFIAFKYVGNGSGVTTTIHIDDIEVIDSDDDTCVATNDCGSVGGGGNAGGETATPLACLSEDFESFTEDQDVFSDYESASLDGDRNWRVREFGDNQYIEMSAFSGTGDYDAWFLVNVDFDNADTFSFVTKDGFNNGDPMTVLYSTSHEVGNTIEPADWTDITSEFTLATGTTSGFADTFTESGNYDLSSISGSGFIAFRYEGNATNLTTTFQVDDITITDNDDANCDNSGGGGTGTACFDEDFEAYDDMASDLDGYHHVATTGDLDWVVRQFSDNQYIQMSAFNGTGDHDTWFIMGVDFSVATGISFDTKDGFNNGDVLTVLYSTDYNEMTADPIAASWTDITSEFAIASGTTSGFADEFTDSGVYDLSALSGTGYVAFRYIGNSDGVTTTMQVDNIQLEGEGTCAFDLIPIDGGGGGTDSDTLLISELADPDNESGARFVELYNYGSEDVSLEGWALQRWTNANTDPQSPESLTGTVSAGGTFVISNNAATFEATYGFAPDLDLGGSGPADSNGDDNIALIDPSGNIHDLFGVPGEDGSGTNHEFEDGRAVRNADIMMANATYTFSEWMIFNDSGDSGTTNEPQMAPDDFTPGVHPDGSGGGGNTDAVLFISEYAEGSSNNKYIEIYNPTSEAVDLADYMVRGSNNGGDWKAERDLPLSGMLGAGEVYVISTDQADQTILDVADLALAFESPVHYNGDDAVGLFFNGTLVDVIGIPTEDPGSAWDVAAVTEATRDQTLVRKTSITSGNSDWASSAGTTADDSEWIVLDQDDWSNINVR